MWGCVTRRRITTTQARGQKYGPDDGGPPSASDRRWQRWKTFSCFFFFFPNIGTAAGAVYMRASMRSQPTRPTDPLTATNPIPTTHNEAYLAVAPGIGALPPSHRRRQPLQQQGAGAAAAAAAGAASRLGCLCLRHPRTAGGASAAAAAARAGLTTMATRRRRRRRWWWWWWHPPIKPVLPVPLPLNSTRTDAAPGLDTCA